MSASRPSVCFVGTHDPAFARTAILAEGLRRCGYEVASCVEPTWGPTAQRVAAARRGFANARLAWRLLRAYARLAFRVRGSKFQVPGEMAPPRNSGLATRDPVWLVPYPGQLDTLVLRALFPRSRIILDAFVSLDETLADRGIGSASGPTRLLARILDRLAFRLADRVLVDTAAHARRFAADYGLDPAKAVVVPVGAFDPIAEFGMRNAQSAVEGEVIPHSALRTPQSPEAIPHSALRTPQSPEVIPHSALRTPQSPEVIPHSALRTPQSPLRVLYFGGFIPLHGLPVILEAARILRPYAGIVLDLVGDGQQADAVEALLNPHSALRTPHSALRTPHSGSLAHVHLHRCWLPEADLIARHIASADVCLGIFADSPKAMDVVPAKVYLAMACGKAVVTADTPAVQEELLDRGQRTGDGGQGGGGVEHVTPAVVVVPPADPEALARALVELRDDPALRARVAASGRRLYADRFRPERVVAPLIAAIAELASVEGRPPSAQAGAIATRPARSKRRSKE